MLRKKIVSDYTYNLLKKLKSEMILATKESITLNAVSNISSIKTEKELHLFSNLYAHDIPYIFLGINNATQRVAKAIDRKLENEHLDLMKSVYLNNDSFVKKLQRMNNFDNMQIIFFQSICHMINLYMKQVKTSLKDFATYQEDLIRDLLMHPSLDLTNPDIILFLIAEIEPLSGSIREIMDNLMNQILLCYRTIQKFKLASHEEDNYLAGVMSGLRNFNSLFANPNVGRFSLSNNQYSILKSKHMSSLGKVMMDIEPIEINFLIDSLIYNLARNSVDHGFTESMQEKDRKTTISGKKTKNGYTLIYSDNGAGMTSEQIKNVFVKGKSTKSGNTGMAMYVWKEKLIIHGGDILVESSPGKGTKFIISIPKESIVT